MAERPRALVTGASAGIGKSFAQHLARTGHDLVIVARREDRLRELAEELSGVDVEILVADLGSDDGMTAVAERISRGGIDLLVNNAGFAVRGAVAETDPAALNKMLRVNILALCTLSIAAMARMTADGRGTIINVSSGTVFMQMPGNAGYGASKNFVMAYTRVMQLEAQGTGVRVQLLVPGLVETEFAEVAGYSLDFFPRERIMQADDLVVASLRALEMDELVCIPSLPEIRDWDNYVAAERQVAAGASRDKPAVRYHGA